MEKENIRLLLKELETLDEKKLETQQNLECYQAYLSKAIIIIRFNLVTWCLPFENQYL